MIKRLLRQLRKKPKTTRDTIAFSVAVFFTGTVTLVWLYYTPKSIGNLNQNLEVAGSPFANFFDTAKRQISETRQVIQGKETSSSTPEDDVTFENDIVEGESVIIGSDSNDDVYRYEPSKPTSETVTLPENTDRTKLIETDGNVSGTLPAQGNLQVPVSLPAVSATETTTGTPANW